MSKKYEVVVHYTGTCTYVVEADNKEDAIRKGRALYDEGADPTQLMTDWETANKVAAKTV